MQVNEVTVAGAGQFTDTVIATFGGTGEFNGYGATQTTAIRPIIFWASFDSVGAAHTLRIYFAVGAAAAENNRVTVYDTAPSGVTINHWNEIGGKGGCLNVWLTTTAAFELRCTTTGKAGDGTFRLAWAWDNCE